ncbi:MAG: glycosyltransferase [Bacteroidales bacterium]|nr:glycosyltransferase [Bacteroidales bacterium]
MISILIPIYNISVCELVHCVHKQAVALNIPFEIILIDDNSEQQWKETNKQLSSLQNVEYKELTENIGRAKIRNLLADTAQYSYLLFLDSDVKIYSEQFLQTYITHCQPNSVVYG